MEYECRYFWECPTPIETVDLSLLNDNITQWLNRF
jgi:hypothetical protein